MNIRQWPPQLTAQIGKISEQVGLVSQSVCHKLRHSVVAVVVVVVHTSFASFLPPSWASSQKYIVSGPPPRPNYFFLFFFPSSSFSKRSFSSYFSPAAAAAHFTSIKCLLSTGGSRLGWGRPDPDGSICGSGAGDLGDLSPPPPPPAAWPGGGGGGGQEGLRWLPLLLAASSSSSPVRCSSVQALSVLRSLWNFHAFWMREAQ